jgi:hypothetical protein
MAISSTSQPVPAPRTRVRTAALLGTSCLVALLCMEGFVRIIEPREVMRYFFTQQDSVLHHKFIPRAVGHYKTTEFDVMYRINTLGLRNEEIDRAKPAGTRRLLMLGDSFTEGDGVEFEETFSHRIQKMLDTTRLGEHWTVINAGVGSYAPLLEYLYLRHEGLALHPDLVVLHLDLSDFFDDLQYTRTARYDEHHTPIAAGAPPEEKPHGGLAAGLTGIKDYLKDHMRLYNFVRLRIDRTLEGMRHNVDMSGNLAYDKYAMLRPGYHDPDDVNFQLTYKYLLLIRDMLADRGIAFQVNLYPYGLQVSPREWNSGRQFWGFKADTLYGIEPQQRIAQFCIRNNIAVTNLCESFRELSKTVYPLYHDYNGHWMPAGHALVARELYVSLLPQLKRMSTR